MSVKDGKQCSSLEIFGCVALVLVMCSFAGFSFYAIHQDSVESKARHEKYKAACEALDVRLGDSLAVKTGPYRGVEMIAIRFFEESIEVYPVVPALLFLPQAQKETTLRFTCDDFEVLKKRVD